MKNRRLDGKFAIPELFQIMRVNRRLRDVVIALYGNGRGKSWHKKSMGKKLRSMIKLEARIVAEMRKACAEAQEEFLRNRETMERLRQMRKQIDELKAKIERRDGPLELWEMSMSYHLMRSRFETRVPTVLRLD